MQYLLIGGPAHGMAKDIENGQSEVTVFVPSPSNPVPTPHKYIRRDVQAETKPGVFYSRIVYVAQNVSPDMATQALAQILLGNFAEELVRQYMEGGTQIGNTEESVPSGTESESLSGSTGRSGDTPSGIIIASR